ncbi:xanthine dehydrogenase molybdopterin binding subunit [Curvivirga sp.]|uniref:xanthine dehydrogenase molybdopterin binding subunit n=1 Tax=Curvivirga sp. TaxID=2856848 RepID=UPI003B5AE8E9
MSKLIPDVTKDKIAGGVHQNKLHDSGHKHVNGQAVYVDDIPEPHGMLHIYMGMSTVAHANIKSMDLSEVRASEGVACVLTVEDIPGINDYSPVKGDDPIFAEGKVEFIGQPIFAVAADTIDLARAAAKKAVIEYEELPAILTIADAMEKGSYVSDPHVMARGDADGTIATAKHVIKNSVELGGQEQFYLEGMIAMSIPGEDDEVKVYSSTQHPSEVQHNVAKALAVPDHAVTIETRRLGGGFGGKESQPALMASVSALVAKATGRAAKMRLDRDDDMVMTGKRHDFHFEYEVGFDDDGVIEGVSMLHACRAGYSSDLTDAIADRAMFHCDNVYWLPNIKVESYRCKTNTVSNTAFRGFGGPQGVFLIERIIDEIAAKLDKDPLEVRQKNFYGVDDNNVTPYHMTVEDNVIHEIFEELEESSDYQKRRAEIREFNKHSKVLKKGIAMTPVKFGISFTTTFLNQAGALVHIYTDGSVKLNHGGIEMGQGLFTKVAQVVAEEFQIDIERVKITATDTSKVPNTSATAASSGSDMNGMAAQAAARTIKQRLTDFAATQFQASVEDVEWLPNRVRVGSEEIAFTDLVKQAYLNRISLSSTGYYATPKIHYDRENCKGRPFFYFSYGAAVTEVLIDTLTGENKITRVDILHDVGKSLNPTIDLGQVEGAYVQGAGWLTTEELWWDQAGRLRTHAPSTYKIPACSDRADDMRISLWEKGKNAEETIYRSKAVGEPPLVLGISAFHAISDAIASVTDYEVYPELDAPATAERVLMAVDRTRKAAKS